ncbi:MAG TPA: hypothetical protein VNO43_17930 [Candidatus Eisenbacteria bacterium]|nr:hypothetical protein [Candidatus Eisenbacteria bacterium]
MKRKLQTPRLSNGRPKPDDFWGLIEELSNLTSDDALVVAAVRNVFGTLAANPTFAPVRTVGSSREKKAGEARDL